MPELPEVETVRRGLAPAMEDARFRNVTLNRADLRFAFPERFAARLTGARVLGLRRRSKYILADLSCDETLLIHLGMSGRVIVENDPLARFAHEAARLPAHDHVLFEMSNGAVIIYNDPRRFGFMDLFATADEAKVKYLAHLGPEPLGNQFHADHLIASFHNRQAPVKSLLLDQKTVSGLGNIYVCEALWRAGIHPARKGARISAPRLATLVTHIRDVLTEAIAAGGSSLRDYRNTSGEMGYFQHRFAVYDKEGKPCEKSGCNGQIKRITQSGRSSFYCSSCQR